MLEKGDWRGNGGMKKHKEKTSQGKKLTIGDPLMA
jgi:hypothetical protein